MSETKQETGNFYHLVFFWLKNPDSLEDRTFFEKELKRFTQNSNFIKTRHIGMPASTNRPVIDSSYTYSLVLSFKSKEDHDKYQIEDVHLDFIKVCKNLWKNVVVYDSESIL